MIKIVAKRYYIENGPELQENLLREVIQVSFPPFVLANSSEDELVSNVKSAFYAVSFLFTIHVCSCRLIWSSIVSITLMTRIVNLMETDEEEEKEEERFSGEKVSKIIVAILRLL